MTLSNQATLVNSFGGYGLDFMKKFMKSFGITGPCRAATKAYRSSQGLPYESGSYRIQKVTKVNKGGPKGKLSSRAQKFKTVEKIIYWAVLADIEGNFKKVTTPCTRGPSFPLVS